MKLKDLLIWVLGVERISRFNSHSYVTNAGKVVTNNAQELIVASSDELDSVRTFVSRNPEERILFYNMKEDELNADDVELFNKVHDTFRSPSGMKAIYDEQGNLRLFYDEKADKPYDIFYVRETFEELPQGAFSLRQRVITFLGPAAATKTTMAELWNMMLCDTFMESPVINIELGNRPGSPTFDKYCEISKRFSDGQIPERSHRGVEIQETSYKVTYSNPTTGARVQSLLQIKDMAGEDWQNLAFDSYVLNENRIPVLVLPMNDIISKHERQDYVNPLDKYLLNYAMKAEDARLIKGYEFTKPIFILSNFDLAHKNIRDPRIEEIWDCKSSLVRDGRIKLDRHKNGLVTEHIEHVSHDLLIPFLRDYAGSILKRMEDICGGEEPIVFACAAVGEEPTKKGENGFVYPDDFVPFNLDEPLLYLLNRDGMFLTDLKEKANSPKEESLWERMLNFFKELHLEEIL
ncbi:MAG: hypothetical protein Q4A32_06785 [Lachnospiraceae bacterium]|nr:hypothetical protein [Lachnospiraceae bacterium]